MGIRGLVAAAAQRDEELSSMGGGFLPEVRLQAGERTHVRFLGNGNEEDDEFGGQGRLFGVAKVHQIMQVSKKGSKYNIDKYCTMEDDGNCEWCDKAFDGSTEGVSKPVSRIAVFCWVQDVWHEHANPQNPSEEDYVQWNQVKTKQNKTYYIEPVERILLFKKGCGNKGYLLNFFMTHLEHYDTLSDRVYEIRREGKGMTDTSYSITPIGESEVLDPDIKQLADELPDIALVLEGKVKHDNETDTFQVVDPNQREETVQAEAPVAKPATKRKLQPAAKPVQSGGSIQATGPINVEASKPAVTSTSALERLRGRRTVPATASAAPTPPEGYVNLADTDDDEDDLV